MLSRSRYIRRINTKGFTILELMIATAVFAVILLVLTAGIIAFSRQYYNGVISTKTQATSRAIMDEVAQSIQLSKTVSTDLTGAGSEGFCVDSKLFSYIIGQQVTDTGGLAANHQGYHGLVVNPALAQACSDSLAAATLPTTAGVPSGQRELLGNGMRLAALDVTPSGNLYTVHVRVIYGEDDLIYPDVATLTSPALWATARCKGGKFAKYCTVSDLTTTVQKRL